MNDYHYQFSGSDVVGSLSQSKNLNAAVKTFLKKQGKAGDPGVKFAKELRDILQRPDRNFAIDFVERAGARFGPHLLAIGAYAHAPVIEDLASKIVEAFADDFNSTYAVRGDELEFKDEEKFREIANKALGMIDESLRAQGFDGSHFMRAIAMNAVFEAPVLRELEGSFR